MSRRWIVVAAIAIGSGCGGAAGSLHSGYKSERAKPWKKPKPIVLDDDKGEGEAEGALDYQRYARAAWYAIDLPELGDLELELETYATSDEDPDAQVDVALEVLDPYFQVVIRADAEEEDGYEATKVRKLYDLEPGRYLVHLYLSGYFDRADYDLGVVFRPKAREYESDFPAYVAFPPRLPQVPLFDDGPPITGRVKVTRIRGKKKKGGGAVPAVPDVSTIRASVIDIVVSGSSSIITVNRGTDHRLDAGMRGYLRGLKDSTFVLSSCGQRRCKATVQATPDQVTRAGSVYIIEPIAAPAPPKR